MCSLSNYDTKDDPVQCGASYHRHRHFFLPLKGAVRRDVGDGGKNTA